MDAGLLRLIQLRKVDVRCRSCGKGSAYTTSCYACSSADLDVIVHGSPGWTHCLAGHSGSAGPSTGVRSASKRPVEAVDAVLASA